MLCLQQKLPSFHPDQSLDHIKTVIVWLEINVLIPLCAAQRYSSQEPLASDTLDAHGSLGDKSDGLVSA